MKSVSAPSARKGIAVQLRFLAMSMLGAYLALNLLIWLLSPLTALWPTYATTALAVPPMVLAMVHGVIPLARRLSGPGRSHFPFFGTGDDR